MCSLLLGFYWFRNICGDLHQHEMAGEIGASNGVFSKQKQFQAIHKLTHLKGPYDRVSSVIVPGILLATCFTLVGRGVYHLATGTGVKAGA
ncbi:hypothetical protein BDL97_05G066200 [Sphagnum fallax]|nr:hypothetical protein BDL97_05G066200 [Sphagnum fallax]